MAGVSCSLFDLEPGNHSRTLSIQIFSTLLNTNFHLHFPFSACVKNINAADKEFRNHLDDEGREAFDNFFIVEVQMSLCLKGGDVECICSLFEENGIPTWGRLAKMYRGDLKRLCQKQVAIDRAIVRKLRPLAIGCPNTRAKAIATHLTCTALLYKAKFIHAYMMRQKTRKVPQGEKNY